MTEGHCSICKALGSDFLLYFCPTMLRMNEDLGWIPSGSSLSSHSLSFGTRSPVLSLPRMIYMRTVMVNFTWQLQKYLGKQHFGCVCEIVSG